MFTTIKTTRFLFTLLALLLFSGGALAAAGDSIGAVDRSLTELVRTMHRSGDEITQIDQQLVREHFAVQSLGRDLDEGRDPREVLDELTDCSRRVSVIADRLDATTTDLSYVRDELQRLQTRARVLGDRAMLDRIGKAFFTLNDLESSVGNLRQNVQEIRAEIKSIADKARSAK